MTCVWGCSEPTTSFVRQSRPFTRAVVQIVRRSEYKYFSAKSVALAIIFLLQFIFLLQRVLKKMVAKGLVGAASLALALTSASAFAPGTPFVLKPLNAASYGVNADGSVVMSEKVCILRESFSIWMRISLFQEASQLLPFLFCLLMNLFVLVLILCRG